LVNAKQSKLADIEFTTVKHTSYILDKMFKLRPEPEEPEKKPRTVKEELELVKEMLDLQKSNFSLVDRQNSARISTLQSQLKQAEKGMAQLALENQQLQSVVEQLKSQQQIVESNFSKKKKNKEMFVKITQDFESKVRAANDQTLSISKELGNAVQESCRLQEEVDQLKKRLRDSVVIGQFTKEDQMKAEIERLTRELNAINIQKSDLIIENQGLQMLVDDITQTNGGNKNDSPPVSKCSVNNVMLDMLFTIITER